MNRGRLTRRLADLVASKFKGTNFSIDTQVPLDAIARTGVRTLLMRSRGRLRFPLRSRAIRIGSKVTIRNAGSMRWGHGVAIGDGAFIDALSKSGVVLGESTVVGKNTRIEGTGSLRTLGHGMTVGKRAGLGTDCYYGCAGGISIGDDTIFGNLVTLHSENHEIERRDVAIHLQGVSHEGIRIGRDCWIGAKATILDGVDMEDGCVVAAGAVLTRGRYEAYGIYGGIPARRIGTRGTASSAGCDRPDDV